MRLRSHIGSPGCGRLGSNETVHFSDWFDLEGQASALHARAVEDEVVFVTLATLTEAALDLNNERELLKL